MAFSSIWSYLCKAAKPKTQLNPTEENHRSFLHAKKWLLTFSKNARKTKRQVFYTWHGASFNTTFGCDFIKEVKHICFFHVVQCAQLQGPSVSSNTALKSQHILEQDTLNLVVDVRGQYWSIQPSHWRRVWRAQGRREHTRADKTTLKNQPALTKCFNFGAADIIPNLNLWNLKNYLLWSKNVTLADCIPEKNEPSRCRKSKLCIQITETNFFNCCMAWLKE